MPASAILWGVTSSGLAYQNTLLVGFSLLDAITDREPRAGSEVLQAPSGVEDAWITGRDFTLAAVAEFIADSPAAAGPSRSVWAGPISWQQFLDYARSKNPFRWAPLTSQPTFYVDGCYLVAPVPTGAGKNDPVQWRALPLKMRNPTVDFTRAWYGVMFEYAPGQSLSDPVVATFTRA